MRRPVYKHRVAHRCVHSVTSHLRTFVVLTLGLSGAITQAAPPAWWGEQGVVNTGVTPDNYAAANVGQLKHMAAMAAAAMNAKLAGRGGAGTEINTMVAAWSKNSPSNYSILNQGQLKAVAKPFYLRLAALGYVGQPIGSGQLYPWTEEVADDHSYAAVNLGQLKRVFSFVISKFAPFMLSGDGSFWIDVTGDVHSWGDNRYGQLGNGTTTSGAQMTLISGLPTKTPAICIGVTHGLAVTTEGGVYAWGDNYFGQLGNDTRTSSRVPVLVQGLSNVVKVSSGDHHSLALDASGHVWAWGGNQAGQLGDGTTSNRLVPIQVQGLPTVVQVAAGADFSVALDANGQVWTWGSNTFGELGEGANAFRLAPGLVAGADQIKSVVPGRHHILALKENGTVLAWGLNQAGQLGNGTTTGQTSPQAVIGLSAIKAVAAGASHSLAMGADGTLWSWGANDVGQLGDGTMIAHSIPAPLSLTGVVELGAGLDHALALTVDGILHAWGVNDSGQLGANATAAFSANPVLVSLPVE